MTSQYLSEYDDIVRTMQMYIDGSRQGKSELMRPAFHQGASFFGYAGEQLAVGTPFLFDWIDKNGPAPNIEPRIVSVDILDSIAVVHLEVADWSGNLAGPAVHMSDQSCSLEWHTQTTSRFTQTQRRPQNMRAAAVHPWFANYGFAAGFFIMEVVMDV